MDGLEGLREAGRLIFGLKVVYWRGGFPSIKAYALQRTRVLGAEPGGITMLEFEGALNPFEQYGRLEGPGEGFIVTYCQNNRVIGGANVSLVTVGFIHSHPWNQPDPSNFDDTTGDVPTQRAIERGVSAMPGSWDSAGYLVRERSATDSSLVLRQFRGGP